MKLHSALRQLTVHVRKTKGAKEASLFYANHIQPMYEYFGGRESVGDTELAEDEEIKTEKHMQYKLQLHMPNGEVIETELIDQRESEDGVEQFKRALDKNYDYIEFEHLNGTRTIPRSIYPNCYLDVIEVDQPIEQAQPTEPTNVGKRVEFDWSGEQKIGVIVGKKDGLYVIRYHSDIYFREKSLCHILEDQPKSNVGRAVRFPQCDENRTGTIAIQSDEQYIIKYGDGYAVRAKDQCELLPE